MLLRWILFAALAFVVIRVIQATMRVLHDGRDTGRDHQPGPVTPPTVRDDFKDAKDADFVELPPEEKKSDRGGQDSDERSGKRA